MDTKTKIKNLPSDIRRLLVDDDLVAAIFVLADEMKISDLQALEIEDRTVRMLAGDLHPSKFVRELASVGLTQEKAYSVARTITTEIVSGVETSLKEMYHVSGPLVGALQKPTQAPTPPIVSKPPAPLAPKPQIPSSSPTTKPGAPQSPFGGPAKTFEKDIARAKSGLPPVPMMTPPIRIERPEAPRPSITTPHAPPGNLPGSPRPAIVSSGKAGPFDTEPSPQTIHVPKNAFEEKLQRTVGGAQQEGGTAHGSSVDPYREPIQ